MQQPTYRLPPEYGESLVDNWVFRILLPTMLGVLIWAIVDKAGQQPPTAIALNSAIGPHLSCGA